ncbi:prolyl oligopeptidase [Kineococcus xinjiangensis]|uniref:prolyl oligopeptidase n=1 Tax=Kineococcus xinjiangensis TaxID=512762 RepID=A0A2S6IJ01_9ACTN|nr:prolyl oligopeptidase family serine peptidase [Kineococcus xinjiangensis]PPK94204.1 prolyl oligopeptidase [Kineococcus xinjiangensis]
MDSPTATTGAPTPPPAPRLDLVEELHGQPVADPYRWLEDADDPRTVAWSAAQDRLFDAYAAALPARDAVAERVRRLMSTGSVGAPVHRGERVFRTRRTPEQELSVLVVTEGGEERVLVDPLALDPAGTTTLDAWRPDAEGRLLAYQLSEGGTEESALRVLDVATGEVVDGPVDRTRYSPVAWLPAAEGEAPAFYYVRRLAPELLPEDERQYHRRVYLHRVGTDPAEDVEVFGAGMSKTNYYGVWTSRDGRWLVVTASDGTAPRNDVWLADLAATGPAAPRLREVVTGRDAQSSAWVGRDGRLYVFTDLDAPRGRLAVADPEQPGPEHWRDLVPQSPDAVLDDVALLDGEEMRLAGREPLLVVGWTRHAVSEITVHSLASGERLPGGRGTVSLPGVGTIGGLLARPEGGHEVWFAHTDTTTPAKVWRFDGRDGSLALEAEPPGAVEVPDVVSRLVDFPGADGTTVRMLVVARADSLAADGSPLAPAPAILYGYGGFGISLSPHYSPEALAWVEAGGVHVVANLRGGGEEGEEWHRAGMRGSKQNVFDDLHAAARALVAGGWTTPAQLCIEGGSNGGLLVGAALTQEPGLYRAVVCSAPLLDMVRYELHGLGATWSDEYGSAAVPEEFGWLLAYSPYHRVSEGTAYPAVLFTVFDSDTRVDPLHARKLCAALQHATSSQHPVLLRREKDVGHGARSLSRSVALLRDTLSFAAAETGLDLTARRPAPNDPAPNDPAPV